MTHAKPIMGTLQLLPLPGAPNWTGRLEEVVARAEQEATTMATGGMDALIIENTFDHPHTLDRIDPAAAIALGLITRRIMHFTHIPIGINVLKNDPLSALAIALNVGAAFIRVPLLMGAAISETGILEGKFRQLAEYRKQLMAESIALYADVSLHRISPLLAGGQRTLLDLAQETHEVGGASAIILTDPDLTVAMVSAITDRLSVPVFVELNQSLDQAAAFLEVCDGLITANPLKKSFVTQPNSHPAVDLAKIEELRALAESVRKSAVTV